MWGNKCDLSLSNGTVNLNDVEQMFNVESLNANILSDHSDSIWDAISSDLGGIVGRLLLVIHSFFTAAVAFFLRNSVDFSYVQ